MALHFTGGDSGWVGKIHQVNVYVADNNGAPSAAQVMLAEDIASKLPPLETQVSDYLDMFVDRGRACGNASEPWWLDEIDLRLGGQGCSTTYSLHLTLDGDDGGLWTVDMRPLEGEHRPVRFERLQG